MLILGRGELWAGETEREGKRQAFLHIHSTAVLSQPLGYHGHKNALSPLRMPCAGKRLEQLSIPNACQLLNLFPFPLFLLLQIKLPTEVTTKETRDKNMPLIWGNQTHQPVTWLVIAAQRDGLPNCSSRSIPRALRVVFLFLGCSSIAISTGAGFACQFRCKKGREHFSFSCHPVSWFSSRHVFSELPLKISYFLNIFL